MPALTGVTYRTATCKYRRFGGGASQGSVTFIPAARVRTSAGVIAIPEEIEVELDASGDLTVSLPVNDDADLEPTGWTYLVIERIDGEKRSWSFELPLDDGSPVDLSEVAPTDPVSPATSYILASSVDGLVDLDDLEEAIEEEATARAAADTSLQSAITAEAATRAAADTAEATARANADTAEASARATADTTLQTNITNEATARAAGDTAEAAARAAAIAALSGTTAPLSKLPYLVAASGGPDDRALVQAAIDAAASAGRSVLLSGGTFPIGQAAHPLYPSLMCGLVLRTNTKLGGMGMGVTVLKNADGSVNDKAPIITNYNRGTGVSDTHINVEDLSIDGNAANQAIEQNGLTLKRVRGVRITRVDAYNIFGGSDASTDNETFAFDVHMCTDVRYTDCAAFSTDLALTTSTGFGSGWSTDVGYVDCVAHDLRNGMGFTTYVDTNVRYVGCHAYRCTGAGGVNARGFNAELGEDIAYVGCVSGGRSPDTSVTGAGSTSPWFADATSLGNKYGWIIMGSKRVSLDGCHGTYNTLSGIEGWTHSIGSAISDSITINGGDFSYNGTYGINQGTATNFAVSTTTKTTNNGTADRSPTSLGVKLGTAEAMSFSRLESGKYYFLPHWANATTGQTGNQNVRLQKVWIPNDITLTRLGAEVTTAGDAGRAVADGVTTSGSATITSATAAFVATDVGRLVTGTGIPANTYILTRNSATSVTLTQNATASGTGVSVTISGAIIRLGIWNVDSYGKPGTLLLDLGVAGSGGLSGSGVINGNSATVQEITLSQALTRGEYWFGHVVQGVTTTQPTLRLASAQGVQDNMPIGTSAPTAGQTIGSMTIFTVATALGTGTGAVPNGTFPARLFGKVA